MSTIDSFLDAKPSANIDSFLGPEPRSALREIGNQLAGGAMVELPKQIGQALEWTSDDGDSVHDLGSKIRAYGESNAPGYEPQPDQHNAVTNAIAGGARMAAPSLAPAAAVAAGLALAPVEVPALVGLGAGAIAGGALTGMAQGQDTFKKAIDAGLPLDEAKEAGRINALIEGGGETIGTLMFGKLLGIAGGAVAKGVGRTAAQSVLDAAKDRSVVKPFLKHLGETAAVETGTEIGQNAGEAAVEKAYGIDNKSPLEAGAEAIGPTLGLTALLAPFGLAGHGARARGAQRRMDALADPKTPVERRSALSDQIATELDRVDPDAAALWRQHTAEKIAGNEPITLDDPMIEAAQPQTEQQSDAAAIVPASGDTALSAGTTLPTAAEPPIQRDAVTGESVHPDDIAAHVAAVQPDAGPLSQAASIAAETGATEAARVADATAAANQDQNAVQAAQEAQHQENAVVEASARQEVLQSVLADKNNTEPTKTFTERVGAPTKEELAAIQHEMRVRDQAAKEADRAAQRRELEHAAAQATRDRPESAAPSPAPAQSPAQPASTQSPPAETSSSAPATSEAASVTPTKPADTAQSSGNGRRSVLRSRREAGSGSAAVESTAPASAEAPPPLPSAPSAQPTQSGPSSASTQPADAAATQAATTAPALPSAAAPAENSAVPEARAAPAEPPTPTALEAARTAASLSANRESPSSSVPSVTREQDSAKSDDADTLKAAHEQLIRSKAQTTAMQRRIIDTVAESAKAIRAGDGAMTTQRARRLREQADTIDRWDPKAAAAVRVLADHVDAVRPKSKLEQGRIDAERAETESAARLLADHFATSTSKFPVYGLYRPDGSLKTWALQIRGRNALQGKADLEAKHGNEGYTVAKIERPASIVDVAAHEAATSPQNDLPEPTDLQREHGNYKKGHIRISGLDIAIENPEGSERSGVGADGKRWSTTMRSHYGYVKRSSGADNDHVDVFVKPGTAPNYSGPVYVVDQQNPDGSFDEHKAMLGWPNEAAAREGYAENYTKGWKVGPITEQSLDEFKAWLDSGKTKEPLAKGEGDAVQEQGAGTVLQRESAEAGTAGRGRGRVESVEQGTEAAGARVAPEAAQRDSEAPAVARPTGKIDDVGEKIGGARKDTSTLTGARAAKAETADDDGPAWAKRFTVNQIVKSSKPGEEGRWSVNDTKSTDWMGQPRQVSTFATKAEAERAIPVAAVALKHTVYGTPDGQFEIVRKVGDRKRVRVVEQTFPTMAAGLDFMANHAVEILETKTSFGEEILPKPDTVKRIGKPRRSGDVTGEQLKETYGFRGVEFGNWNNQDERQQVMNHAFDALADLAEVLDIPAPAIGLNGELGLAFGARGQGLSGARAHYERNYGVINLTKMSGAGSLAHEWFHSLDHHFGRQDGKTKSVRVTNERGDKVFPAHPTAAGDYASHGFRAAQSGVRPEVRTAYAGLIRTMYRKAEQYVQDTEQVNKFVGASREDVAKALGKIRGDLAARLTYGKRNIEPATAEQLAEFDGIAERLIAGEGLDLALKTIPRAGRSMPGSRWTNDALEQISAVYKAVRGRSGFGSGDQHGPLDDVRGALGRYDQRLKMLANAQAGTEQTKQVPTSFAMEAKSIDQGRATDYWSSEHEMAARAFQSYIEDKIAGSEGQSDFLTYGTNLAVPTPWGWKRPFPTGAEREAINAAFDKLFATMESKPTAQGEMLYDVTPYALLGRQPPTKLEPRFTRMVIDRLQRKWPGAPDIVVARDEAALNVPEGVTGAYDRSTGRVYVVERNIRSHEHLRRVLAHEIVGHASVQQMLGPERFADVLQQINRAREMGNKELRNLAALVQETHGDLKLSPEQEASEIIARAAEHAIDESGNVRPEYGWFAKILSYVKQWLREIGLNVPFSNAELSGLLARAAARVEKAPAATASPIVGPQLAPQFSTGKPTNATGGEQDYSVLPQSVANVMQRARSVIQSRQANTAPPAPTTPPAGAAFLGPVESKLDDVIYVLQDKHVDTRRVIEAIRQQGQQVNDAQDPYLQEELYHGRAAKKADDFLNQELKPLLAEMQSRKVTIADFEKYLHARHAEERNAQIAKVNPSMPDGGSGMTTADAKAYLAGLSAQQRADFSALAGRVDAISAETRRELVAYGLESPATIAAWSQAYKNYVPLMRDMSEPTGTGTGTGFSVKGDASKRATGSTRDVDSILGNLALQRERAIVRGEKNVVANALVGLAEANPNPDFWKVDTPPKITYIDPQTGLVTHSVDPLYKSRENVVMARTPGPGGEIVERSVTFNDSDPRAMRMSKALKNLDVDNIGRFLGMSAKVTRYFAAVNTQLNPLFGIVNITRDSQQAMFNLTSTLLAGKQAEVARNILPALKGVYLDLRAARAGKAPTSTWAQTFEEFQNEGGQTGYRDMFHTGKERAEALEKEIRQASEGKAKQTWHAVLGWVSDYNTAMENAVRLSAYKVARDSGVSKQRAASIAKNLTVNFNRKGQIATQAGALYAFFNANVQGTARLAETLAGPMGRKIILGGVTLGAVQALALAAAGYDDNDPPDFVRERNVIIPIGDKKYITIPMPLGLHFIPNIGRIPTEFALSGFRDPAKHALELMSVFADAFNPIGSAGVSLQTIAPTVVDPFAALSENKDYTGKPIARPDFNPLAPTAGHTRAKDSSTVIGKAVSKALNFASGGTDYKPGLFSPTPDQVDYLLGQAAGGLGREALKIGQTLSSPFTGDDLPTYKIPLIGRFYGNVDQPASQASAFYSNLKAINEHEAEIKGRARHGEPIDGYLAANPEARLFMAANAAERQVSQMRKRRRELVERDADADTLHALDEQMTARMRAFNDVVNRTIGREA